MALIYHVHPQLQETLITDSNQIDSLNKLPLLHSHVPVDEQSVWSREMCRRDRSREMCPPRKGKSKRFLSTKALSFYTLSQFTASTWQDIRWPGLTSEQEELSPRQLTGACCSARERQYVPRYTQHPQIACKPTGNESPCPRQHMYWDDATINPLITAPKTTDSY
jgi:hypothetical protein